jgi:hypothetical protein
MWQRRIKYSMLNRVAKKVYAQSFYAQSCFTAPNLGDQTTSTFQIVVVAIAVHHAMYWAMGAPLSLRQ